MIGAGSSASIKKGGTQPPDNNIHGRISEVCQLLAKNNAAFTRAVPSEEQLKALLEHTFNCYDQLDFIYLDYSRNPSTYLDPKLVAEHTHKVFRSTKYLFNHLRYWFDSYSIQLFKKTNDFRSALEPQRCLRLNCCMCQNNVNEMKIKEAKESMLGPMHWRQIYEEELREEREAVRKEELWENKEESKEYIGSVNFLAKIIREMEESAKNYDKLAEKVQNQNFNEEHTLFALEELISKLKYKLGEKYRIKFQTKLRQLLKKMEEKTPANATANPNPCRILTEVSLAVLPQEPKQQSRASAKLIQDSQLLRLKDQNRRLQIQNIELSGKYQSLKEHSLKNQAGSTISRSQSRKNSQNNPQPYRSNQNERSSQVNKIRNTLAEIPQNKKKAHSKQASQEPAQEDELLKSKKKKLVSKMSAFHLKKFESRTSQMTQYLDRTTEEACKDISEASFLQQNDESLGSIASKHSPNNQHSLNNHQHQTNQQQLAQKKEVACQWEQSIFDSLNARRLGSIKSPTKKKTPGLTINQKEGESNLCSENEPSKFQSQNNLVSLLNTKKSLTHNAEMMRHNGSDNTTRRQESSLKKIKEGYRAQGHILQHPKQSMNSINFQQGQHQNHKKSSEIKRVKKLQAGKQNRTSHQNHREPKQKVVARSNMGFLLKNVKLQTQYESSKKDLTLESVRFQMKNDKMPHLKARIMTQQSAYLKKNKIIRNIIFKPEHLTLFGGVSESYAYQNWKTDLMLSSLSQNEQNTFKSFSQFVQNLKNFKTAFYENILCFLKSPFQTIEKNQIQFRCPTKQMTSKVLLKLLLFHKNKCGTAECEHLENFFEEIGFLEKQLC